MIQETEIQAQDSLNIAIKLRNKLYCRQNKIRFNIENKTRIEPANFIKGEVIDIDLNPIEEAKADAEAIFKALKLK